MTDPTPRRTEIPHFSRGTWTTIPDPINWDAHDDLAECVRHSGYANRGGIPEGESLLRIDILARVDDGSPKFILDVEIGSYTYQIAAGDEVDVLDLITRWAPGIQAVMIGETTAAVFDQEEFSRYGAMAGLGARIAYGAERANAWAREAAEVARKRRTPR